MTIGFTGTRLGMTGIQRSLVRQMLEYKRPRVVVHGGCVGADSDFHDIVRLLFSKRQCQVHVFPSNIRGTHGHIDGDVVFAEHPPLQRNGFIVSLSDELIACPEGCQETNRSGTWSTVRRARKKKIPIHIFYPE